MSGFPISLAQSFEINQAKAIVGQGVVCILAMLAYFADRGWL